MIGSNFATAGVDTIGKRKQVARSEILAFSMIGGHHRISSAAWTNPFNAVETNWREKTDQTRFRIGNKIRPFLKNLAITRDDHGEAFKREPSYPSGIVGSRRIEVLNPR